MDFLGMGMGEILLILIVALIIFGPGRIVEIGRTLGKTIRTLKKASSDLTTQLSKEFEVEKDGPPRSKESIGDKGGEPAELDEDEDKAEPGDTEMAGPAKQ